MLHVCRYQVERDLFSIVFDWLALLDARSSSLSVGIVFETWCRPRARPPLSLCISSGFQETGITYVYLPTSSFFPLLGSETSLVQTAPKQAGTAYTRVSLPQELQQYTRRVCGTRCAHFTGLAGA